MYSTSLLALKGAKRQSQTILLNSYKNCMSGYSREGFKVAMGFDHSLISKLIGIMLRPA